MLTSAVDQPDPKAIGGELPIASEFINRHPGILLAEVL
jgi:hypothetical protein